MVVGKPQTLKGDVGRKEMLANPKNCKRNSDPKRRNTVGKPKPDSNLERRCWWANRKHVGKPKGLKSSRGCWQSQTENEVVVDAETFKKKDVAAKGKKAVDKPKPEKEMLASKPQT